MFEKLSSIASRALTTSKFLNSDINIIFCRWSQNRIRRNFFVYICWSFASVYHRHQLMMLIFVFYSLNFLLIPKTILCYLIKITLLFLLQTIFRNILLFYILNVIILILILIFKFQIIIIITNFSTRARSTLIIIIIIKLVNWKVIFIDTFLFRIFIISTLIRTRIFHLIHLLKFILFILNIWMFTRWF